MLNQDLWVSLERDLINALCCTHFCSVMIYIQKDIVETKEQKENKADPGLLRKPAELKKALCHNLRNLLASNAHKTLQTRPPATFAQHLSGLMAFRGNSSPPFSCPEPT